MVRSAGIEPTTICLEGRCSIQLSYERKNCLPQSIMARIKEWGKFLRKSVVT